MTPLESFNEIAGNLAKKPFFFLDTKKQELLISTALDVLKKMKIQLEKKNLEKIEQYKTVTNLFNTLNKGSFNEVEMISFFQKVVTSYYALPSMKEKKEQLDDVSALLSSALEQSMEYSASIDKLKLDLKDLSEENIIEHDLKVLQDIGVFYVLEYTLQVLFEFSRLSNEEKEQLLKEGLNIGKMKLPAWLELEDTFRKNLCFQIFSNDLRNKLLRIFYQLEEIFLSGNLEKISVGIKEFNIQMLKEFNDFGYTKFHALIYDPFGNDLSTLELIDKIKKL